MTKFIKDENSSDAYVSIDAQTIGETRLAVRFDDGDKKFWIPMSCLEDWPDMYKTGEVIIKRWFAEEKGLC